MDQSRKTTPVIGLHANDLILFAHIVEAGSLTRAAAQTGLPKSTLSRRLSDLESAFGERLMQRSTRRQELTEFGAQMLDHARLLRDEAEAANALAQHRKATPQGVLRVSLLPSFHELPILPVITEFTARYPHVRLQLDLSARRVDLLAERFDIAVRAAEKLPDDSMLVARRIATLESRLYASPAYLERHPPPQTPADLADHAGLALVTSGGDQMVWRLTSAQGQWTGLPTRTHAANSPELMRALAVEGLGIVGLSEHFARPLIRDGSLRPVLPDWHLPSNVLWCVTPGRRLLPQRTTAFIDLLKAAMSSDRQSG